jgi:hypothetical protein
VAKYNKLFESLVLRITNLEEAEAIHKYTFGLKPHIRAQVRLRKHTTLEECMNAALIVDGTSYQGYTRPNFS